MADESKESEPKSKPDASQGAHLEPRMVDWLWIGERSDAKNEPWLRKNNIKYILNCTQTKVDGGVPNFHSKNSYFEYCRLEMMDTASQGLSSYFEKAFDFLERARIREDGDVLIHCNQGVSRSTSMLSAYLMKHYRYDLQKCLTLVSDVRPQACPNSNFMSQLVKFEKKLKDENDYGEEIKEPRPKISEVEPPAAKRRKVAGPS